ncbi:MAG: AAA family ATPase [Planctomycetaceae bacterium]|nr:AAA family ATPase [Planctomycetaceae bacterium]
MSTRTDMFLKGLHRPDAYPHAIDEVAVRETHISWIFLTGEFAYKVKKPVRTSFLNFRTLELRRAACHEELRLNRRYAPDLYIDVLPIAGTTATPKVDGNGPPIEYAVRMRQFPEAALLSQMADAGMLTSARIDELADVVGCLHRTADRVLASAPWGHADAIIRESEENIEALEAAGYLDLSDALDHLQRWTADASRRLHPRFEQRRADGFVRECHGDLHLGNIVVWHPANPRLAPELGRVTPFDGIEFNPEFRWIDVVSDIAFTVMDLDDRGHWPLANRLLNAWLEYTGDYAGLAVLDWYLVYRALVRAKVALIRAGQERDHSEVRQRQLEEAFQYVRLAEAYTRRHRPQLAITVGASGSGKTTGSQPLVDQLGFIRIRSDVERKRLAGLSAEAQSRSPVGDGLYTSEQTGRTYARLADLAGEILRAGRSVVVDATFLQREQRSRFQELADRCGVQFTIIPFDADAATLRERIEARRLSDTDASEARIDVLESQLKSRESLTPDERSLVQRLADMLANAASQ